MTQSEGGILVSFVGVFTVWIGATDALFRYLRPSMRPWLVAAGVALVLIGLATTITGRRAGERTRLRIGWLLIAPLGVHALLNPGPLGSFAARQQSTSRFISTDFDLEKYLGARSFGGQTPELRVVDFVAATQKDRDRELLSEQPVRLTGFVGGAFGGPHRFTLTRFLIGCCAGDAYPLEVAARGVPSVPATDTWVRVEGTYVGHWRPEPGKDFALPSLQVDRVERVEEPHEPYEYP